MIANERDDLRPHIVSIKRVYVQLVEKTQRGLDARFFVSARAQASVDEFRRRGLTKVMTEGSNHYGDLLCVWKIIYQLARPIDDKLRMKKDISFWMPFGILRHVDERFDFRKQLIDGAKTKQALQ